MLKKAQCHKEYHFYCCFKEMIQSVLPDHMHLGKMRWVISVSRSLQENWSRSLTLVLLWFFVLFCFVLSVYWNFVIVLVFLFSQNVALDLYRLLTKCSWSSVQIQYSHCLVKMEAVEGCCMVKTCSLSWMLVFHLSSLRHYLYSPSHFWWIRILHAQRWSLLDRIDFFLRVNAEEGGLCEEDYILHFHRFYVEVIDSFWWYVFELLILWASFSLDMLFWHNFQIGLSLKNKHGTWTISFHPQPHSVTISAWRRSRACVLWRDFVGFRL